MTWHMGECIILWLVDGGVVTWPMDKCTIQLLINVYGKRHWVRMWHGSLLCVWHGLLINVTWLIHEGGITWPMDNCTIKWTIMCMKWGINVCDMTLMAGFECDMTHCWTWYDSLMSVTWLIDESDMTWPMGVCTIPWLIEDCDLTWPIDKCTVKWLIRECDMIHWCVWHDSLMGMTGLIECEWDMTHWCAWHDTATHTQQSMPLVAVSAHHSTLQYAATLWNTLPHTATEPTTSFQ